MPSCLLGRTHTGMVGWHWQAFMAQTPSVPSRTAMSPAYYVL